MPATATKKAAPRKRAAARKTTAKAPKSTEPKGLFRANAVALERYAEQGEAVLKATKGDRAAINPDLAKRLDMSVSKADRLFTFSQLKDGEKLYTKDLTEAEFGKELVDLRDNKGLRWMPDIWARTLVTQDKARAAYEDAGGKAWASRNGDGAAEKTAPRRKPTARAKRSAKKAPSGGGTRSKRAGLLVEVHDLGTTEERMAEILDGRELTYEFAVGDKTLITKYRVEGVKGIGFSQKHGRFVEFKDAQGGQIRIVPLSEITSIR